MSLLAALRPTALQVSPEGVVSLGVTDSQGKELQVSPRLHTWARCSVCC